MENALLIARLFKTDISSLDLMQVIVPKEWPALSANPVFNSIDGEIIDWLKQNLPTTYEVACATSNRKPHDQILINAIKAKILFEQLDYIGLRSLQKTRYFNLFGPIFENTFKYVAKAYKKHDVKSEYIEFRSMTSNYNISPDRVADSSGFYSKSNEESLNELLIKQPDSEYLQLCKKIMEESKFLDKLRRSIEEINFEPKDRSDYQTCACCFRWVRLQPKDRTRIAYHGYTICRYSYNDVVSSSCLGADFAPFQVSADGTIAHLKQLRNRITELSNEVASETDTSALLAKQRRIKHIESDMQFAISKISATHPDRLEEAQSI